MVTLDRTDQPLTGVSLHETSSEQDLEYFLLECQENFNSFDTPTLTFPPARPQEPQACHAIGRRIIVAVAQLELELKEIDRNWGPISSLVRMKVGLKNIGNFPDYVSFFLTSLGNPFTSSPDNSARF